VRSPPRPAATHPTPPRQGHRVRPACWRTAASWQVVFAASPRTPRSDLRHRQPASAYRVTRTARRSPRLAIPGPPQRRIGAVPARSYARGTQMQPERHAGRPCLLKPFRTARRNAHHGKEDSREYADERTARKPTRSSPQGASDQWCGRPGRGSGCDIWQGSASQRSDRRAERRRPYPVVKRPGSTSLRISTRIPPTRPTALKHSRTRLAR